MMSSETGWRKGVGVTRLRQHFISVLLTVGVVSSVVAEPWPNTEQMAACGVVVSLT